MGRRLTLDEHAIASIPKEIADGLSLTMAAEACGYEGPTVNLWRNKGEALARGEDVAAPDESKALYLRFFKAVSRAHEEYRTRISRVVTYPMKIVEQQMQQTAEQEGRTVYIKPDKDDAPFVLGCIRESSRLAKMVMPEVYGDVSRAEALAMAADRERAQAQAATEDELVDQLATSVTPSARKKLMAKWLAESETPDADEG